MFCYFIEKSFYVFVIDWLCYFNVKKKIVLGKMDFENIDFVVEIFGNDVIDSDNINFEERVE